MVSSWMFDHVQKGSWVLYKGTEGSFTPQASAPSLLTIQQPGLT